MKVFIALLIVVCTLGQAVADAPRTSIRPMPRPVSVVPVIAVAPSETLAAMPDLARKAPPPRPISDLASAPIAAPEKPRKGLLALIAPRAKPTRKAVISTKGSICGLPSIKGKTLPRITSKTKGCGIEDPVSVTSVNGARLSVPATIDCPTAVALNTWVQKGLRPAFPGSEVVGLTVFDSYSCRPRNNVRGAKISEHGRGRAVDIAAVTFANGKTLTVARDFKSLRKAYKAGCGIFTTTLGPGSDGYHEDHMHFDTARHRNGAYCR